jgi:low temperature requirement A protein (LtrA)
MDAATGFGGERDHRVTPLELFFDLVFAFAFTQVTTLRLDEPSWTRLARGLLLLAILWWVWASYAWLTNSAQRPRTRGNRSPRRHSRVVHQRAPGPHCLRTKSATFRARSVRCGLPLAHILRDLLAPTREPPHHDPRKRGDRRRTRGIHLPAPPTSGRDPPVRSQGGGDNQRRQRNAPSRPGVRALLRIGALPAHARGNRVANLATERHQQLSSRPRSSRS